MNEARCIAVTNQKGGVGKTTSAINLSAFLAIDGARVLLIDLDPQANATTGMGVDPRRAAGNSYQILVTGKSVEDSIEPTNVKNLYCVASGIDLAGAEIELVPAFSRETKLKAALASVLGEFDFIFIDCPPALGLLTVNALAAASEVIVPIQCEYYALEGLSTLLRNVGLVQSSLNAELEVSRILLTMYDSRTKLSDEVAKEVRAHFPGRVFEAVIPRSVKLSEAPSFGQPIGIYAPRSKGARAYAAAAAELAQMDKGQRVLEMPDGFSNIDQSTGDAATALSQAASVKSTVKQDRYASGLDLEDEPPVSKPNVQVNEMSQEEGEKWNSAEH